MRLALACLPACLLACLAFTAHAQSGGVYKWKDARGVTHYSDTPPPTGRYGNVQPDPSARVAPAAKVDPRCATARANIAQLKSGRSDIGLDADRDGKPDKPLDAAQRADQLRMAEASERTFCTPATP
jgi:hypothetical protein